MWKKPFLIVLCFVVFGILGPLIYVTGAIDYIPRLRASATSPDGSWAVRVYQKRLEPGPLFPRMGAIAQVYDQSENLVFEEIIFKDDDWDDDLGGLFETISFEGDDIRISPGAYGSNHFVIKTADLRSHTEISNPGEVKK